MKSLWSDQRREIVEIDLRGSTFEIGDLERTIVAIRQGADVTIKNAVGGLTLAEIYSYLIREGVSLSPTE